MRPAGGAPAHAAESGRPAIGGPTWRVRKRALIVERCTGRRTERFGPFLKAGDTDHAAILAADNIAPHTIVQYWICCLDTCITGFGTPVIALCSFNFIRVSRC